MYLQTTQFCKNFIKIPVAKNSEACQKRQNLSPLLFVLYSLLSFSFFLPYSAYPVFSVVLSALTVGNIMVKTIYTNLTSQEKPTLQNAAVYEYQKSSQVNWLVYNSGAKEQVLEWVIYLSIEVGLKTVPISSPEHVF